MIIASQAAYLISELLRAAAPVFVSGLWQGCVLAAAVALCLRLLPTVASSARFATWMMAFVLIAALPWLSLGLHRPSPAPDASMVHLGEVWAVALGIVWATSTAARATELLIQLVQLHEVWARAEHVAVDAGVFALLQRSARPAELCVSSDVNSPGVIGFFRPRLLIPQALYPALTPVELQQIVLHESEHLRRRDDWLNLLQKIALVLFPFNLALLWVDRRLAFERELACDACVVASTGAPLQYARCLTELAEHSLGRRRLALLLPAWHRQSELARRVLRLLGPMKVISPLWTGASAMLLSVCIGGTALALARAPRLVSFDSKHGEASLAPALRVPSAQKPALLVVRSNEKQEYAANAGASAKLVRAQLISVNTHSRSPVAGRRHSTASRQKLASPQPRHRSGPRFVLTGTMPRDQQADGDGRPAWLPAAMLIEISASYAAVPFGDGWLVIRL